jgi:serine/threonine protein phosphatase PrpC
MRSALLCGRHHHRVGGLELIAEGPTAIALSRGGARKTYSHTDPNEDCVAFATGPGGQLVVAADGHHGELGSEAAVQSILETVAETWTAAESPVASRADWRQQGLDALMEANHAILRIAGKTQLPPAPTTFVLALVRPQDDLLLHLSVGDSHVFAVDRRGATELGGRDPDWKFTPFLGYQEARAEMLEKYAMMGERSLQDLRAIVLATDGLSEPGIGVEDPAKSVFGVVSEVEVDAPLDRRATDACRAVAETAMRAHRRQKAGDNMGCSVIWLGP